MVSSPKDINKKIGHPEDSYIYIKGSSLISKSMGKFFDNKVALSGLIFILLLFVFSVLSNITAPYSYDEGILKNQNMPPTWYKLFISKKYKTGIIKWAETKRKEDNIFNSGTQNNFTGDNTKRMAAKPRAQKLFDKSISHLNAEGIILFFNMSKLAHIFGTDELGQDIFSRLIYGIKLSLLLSLSVTMVSLFIGIIYGAISGYMGGLTDQVMMRIVDFLFGIPFIFLIILLMVFFGRRIILIFIGLGLVYWIVLARIVRGQILSLREKEFVLAAISNGENKLGIIFRHLIPNIMGPVIVFSTLLVPQIILLEAFLSFIGLGVSPPDVSLGIMISDGAAVLTSYSWPIIYPGIIFSLIIFFMNFIGDGLRDAFDPKTK
ncbi:ABC transporter permease [Spirochaetota bacterium]